MISETSVVEDPRRYLQKCDGEIGLLDNTDSIIQNSSQFIDQITKFNEINRSKVKRNKKAYYSWKFNKKVTIENHLKKAKNDLLSSPGIKTSNVPYNVIHHPNSPDYLNITAVENYQSEYERYKEKLNNLPDLDKNLTNFVVKKFKDYLLSLDGIRSMVLGINKDDKWVGFEVFNRFSSHYYKELMNKLRPLNEEDFAYLPNRKVDLNKSVLLTLTYNPEIVKTKEEAWENVAKDFNRFNTHLKTRTKHRIPHLDYIRIIEAQENGYPHIHTIYFGIDWLLLNGTFKEYQQMKIRNDGKPTIQSLWKRGFTWVNRTSENKTIRQPLSYIFKLVQENHEDLDNRSAKIKKKSELTKSYLWFFNRRIYNVSRDLGKWINENYMITDIEGNEHKEIDVVWIGILVFNSKSLTINSIEDLVKQILDLDYG